MKRLTLLILVIFLSLGAFAIVKADSINKDDVLFARYSLRGEGNTIFFHNMSLMPVLVPIGTEVKVASIGKEKLVVKTVDNKKKYQMLVLTDFWDKFFVKNKNEIGLETLSAEKKTLVENNQVVEGMTKEEVYLSKGCPAFIGYGVKSYNHPLEDVIKSDVWYYNVNSRLKDMVVTFENGRVKGVAGRETKVKQKVEAVKEKK